MRRVLAIAAVTCAAVLGVAIPAQAHNYLVASTPAEGETLTQLPDEFSVTTNEPMLTLEGGTNGFAFQVVDAAGLHYETGCVDVADATMSMEARLGAAGEYTALWQIVSADGHSVSDSIAFTWAPEAGFEPALGSADAPACGDALPTAAPTATPTQPSAPPVTAAPQPATASVTDVLWIGGALVAVGIAVAVTIAVVSRKKR